MDNVADATWRLLQSQTTNTFAVSDFPCESDDVESMLRSLKHHKMLKVSTVQEIAQDGSSYHQRHDRTRAPYAYRSLDKQRTRSHEPNPEM